MASRRLNQIKWINNLIFWFNSLLVLMKKNPLFFLLSFWTLNFLHDFITSSQMEGGIEDLRMPLVHFTLGTPFILFLFFYFFPPFVGRGKIITAIARAILLIIGFLVIKEFIHLEMGLTPVLTDLDQLIKEHFRLLKFFVFALAVWLFYEFILVRAYNNQIMLLLAKTQISNDYLSLSPHMLFNSLNNIVGKSALYSDELYHQIVAFSALLKQSYKDPTKPHSIYDELNILNNMLVCIRTTQRKIYLFLTIRHAVPLEFYQIPRLVLATLLDNVFRHGIYMDEGSPAEVKIYLLPDKDQNLKLVITTYNKINPIKPFGSSGHGLKAILNVLQNQFGDSIYFECEKCDDEYSTLLIISYGQFENSTHR